MRTVFKTVSVAGINVFYREAGPKGAPTIVLLHGFPSSSHMYRDLIRDLSDEFHVVAPDYPGFGSSDMPGLSEYQYNFENLANTTEEFLKTVGVNRYSLYMQDYGGPVGFRLATRNPHQIESLIIQNANAYPEGLSEAMAPLAEYWVDRAGKEPEIRKLLRRETTLFQYTHGAKKPESISPDSYNSDQAFLDRAGNDAIQLELLYQYQHNLECYPEWHAYFKQHQPRTLIVWGKNDPFFSVPGAEAYKKDLKNVEMHLIDGGHFVLEEAHEEIAGRIATFFGNQVQTAA